MEEKIRELGMVLEEVTPKVLFKIGPLDITTTIVAAWIVMIIMLLFFMWLTRNMKVVPTTKKQLVAEYIVTFLYGIIDDTIGKKGRKYIVLVGSYFIFILFMNLSWFIPELKPATTDTSVTFALSIIAILSVQVIGIKEKGLRGYRKYYLRESPVLLPLNLIEELVKPVSLGLRLFGNMFGEELVVTVLFIMLPLFLPLPVQMLGVLMACIQAFVFTLLTSVYISGIISEEH